MKGRFLLGSNESFLEGNIYADKSSIVLAWLLGIGLGREDFSLREVAKDCNVSVGLVQKVFSTLALHGLLQITGVRTAKRFLIKKPSALLKSWLDQYSVLKKCKMWTYRSALPNKKDLLETLKTSPLNQKVALALHSSAEAHGYKNTNLETLELYMLEPGIKADIENALELKPQERGYEVLLIEPYYKSLLKRGLKPLSGINISPVLLTFLDLYHFPLRGREQAEFMAERNSDLKRIEKRK